MSQDIEITALGLLVSTPPENRLRYCNENPHVLLAAIEEAGKTRGLMDLVSEQDFYDVLCGECCRWGGHWEGCGRIRPGDAVDRRPGAVSEEMHLYAVSILTSRKGFTSASPAVVLSVSPGQAYDDIERRALEEYPIEDGYYDHDVRLLPVPDDMIAKLLPARPGAKP